MSKLYNRAGVSTATSGTGTITLGSALAAGTVINAGGFQDFATAGAANSDILSYLILDANNAWEYGTGTYTSAGTTLSRTLGQSSTGSLLSLSGSAQVFIVARSTDLAQIATTNTFTADQILMAGTTALAPLKFTSGTNLTTPVAGAMEYDGACHYATHAASERGVINAEQWCRLSSTYTLANQTAAQKLFNASTNGAVTVAGSTTYQFECCFNLTAMAGTNSFGFAIGGAATLTSIRWMSLAQKGAAVGSTFAIDTSSIALRGGWTFNDTAANTAITPSAGGSSGTTAWASVRGIICVNGGGTLIPQVSLGTAAAAVVGINSFFRLWPIGSDTAVTLGNWS